MSRSSYDELMKQVHSLKLENTQLRQELQDNSSHLTKLENDAATMKNVLGHLNSSDDEIRLGAGDIDLNISSNDADNSECSAVPKICLDSLDRNYSGDEFDEEQNWDRLVNGNCFPGNPGIQRNIGMNLGTNVDSQKALVKQPSNLADPTLPNKLNESCELIDGCERINFSSQSQTEDPQDNERKQLCSSRLSGSNALPSNSSPGRGNQHHLCSEDDSFQSVYDRTASSQSNLTNRENNQTTSTYSREQSDQASRGGRLVTIATQTNDVFQEELPTAGEGFDYAYNDQKLSMLYHGGWPLEDQSNDVNPAAVALNPDTASVMSFTSTNASTSYRLQHHQLGTKVEMVYSLLSMLGTHDKDDMSKTLLNMSSSQDSCIAMRQSGCLPLLIQLLHGNNKELGLLDNSRGSQAARARAAIALHNIVHSNPDSKRGRREARVLRLLEQIRAHCDQLMGSSSDEVVRSTTVPENVGDVLTGMTDIDHHPGPAIAALMKLSFDEEHRQAICNLGGLQAIAALLQLDQEVNGNTTEQYNITMRRYACMALTNLTFGDGTNKALLCSLKLATKALVMQLRSSNEDLRQVAASVLRNLSWRANTSSKKTLREAGSVSALMEAAMAVEKESTLKSILSALWNLSAHCSENKADICAVKGALEFLVATLTYKSASRTMAVVENGGGILRNISSHIAVHEEYRQVLRCRGCLPVLLRHLQSPSLTIVSNACGTLWNISARCPEDQQALWELGAVNMLRNLVNSKHKMISMGSAAALKNLLSFRPPSDLASNEQHAGGTGLHIRRQKALEAELDRQELTETCDNIEALQSNLSRSKSQETGSRATNPYELGTRKLQAPVYNHVSYDAAMADIALNVGRSDSRDSVGSTHSDISHDRVRTPNLNFIGSRVQQVKSDISSSYGYGMGVASSDLIHGRNNAGRMLHAMQQQDTKMNSSIGAVEPGLYLKDPMIAKVVHSLESSPVTHHRIPAAANNFLQSQPSKPFVIRNNNSVEVLSGAKKTSSINDNKESSILSSDSLSHISQRMQNVHLLMPELEEDQDEPINFSTKYVEVQLEPSHVQSMAPSAIWPGGPSQLPGQTRNCANQVCAGQMMPSSGAVRMPLMSKGFTSDASQTAPPNNQSLLANQLSSRDAGSIRHQMPPGCLIPNNHTMTSHPSVFVKPIPKLQNSIGGMYPVPQNIGTAPIGMAPVNIDLFKKDTNLISQNFTAFGKASLDIEPAEMPTNYSIQYAEKDEEDDTGYSEQPIDYSTRYTEPEMEYKISNVHSTATDFYDDTVKTFCTEDTPMNYLSTATSMNDLRQPRNVDVRKDDQSVVTPGNNQQMVPGIGVKDALRSDQKAMMEAGPNAGGTTTSAAALAPARQDVVNHLPSIYSYKDSPGADSPCEKPQRYCTEGTPVGFSRASSLSSLQSGDVDENQTKAAPVVSVVEKTEVTLQSIRENETLDLNSSNPTKFVASKPTTDAISHHPKTVTFDETNQTPMMFSRCSSLGSLSSFDAHSVHSSVISEYSRRASEVVSPSDLPDSPCDTMPPSPSYKTAAVRFQEANKPSNGAALDSSANQPDDTIVAADQQKPKFSEQSSPVHYADEGSPVGAFSSATSLSAITMDDDDLHITKEYGMRVVPLGEEMCPADSSNKTKTDFELSNLNIDDDDDDNSSVSEGEENMLAECISLAMPSKGTSKKMVRSSSDGIIKQKLPQSKINPSPATVQQNCPPVSSKLSSSPSMGAVPIKNFPMLYRTMIPPNVQNVAFAGCDSPKKFATEDTPLNHSHSDSMTSDQSNSDDVGNLTVRFVEKPENRAAQGENDNNSSLSDSDDDYNDDLLSEVIQAAMPKSKKPPKAGALHSADSSKKNSLLNSKPSQKPIFGVVKGAAKNTLDILKNRGYTDFPAPDSNRDCTRTYAVEGTPLEFSRSTSLSNLTIDSAEMANEKPQSAAARQMFPRPASSNNMAFMHAPENEDVLHSYGIEGTPITFSRNDSLSSLSGEEGDEGDKHEHIKLLNRNKGGNGEKVTASSNDVPSCLTMPAVARLKTPCKTGSPKSRFSRPNSTSTPVGKSHQQQPASVVLDDQVIRFAVEDTPDSMSRNLSPTREMVHDFLASDDKSMTFKVENTPNRFSCNSSLSSLSFESIGFEATSSENAMLEQCISAALPIPKSKRKKGGGKPRQLSLETHQTNPEVRRSLMQADPGAGSKYVSRPQAAAFNSVSGFVNGSESTKNDLPTKFTDKSSSLVKSCLETQSVQKREVSAMESSGLASSTGVSDNVSSKSQTGSVKCESSVSTSGADIMQESFPEFSSSLFSDLTPEEDCLQSGPSTEANNTVIYRGSILADGKDDSILGSEQATGNDSTLGCVARNNTLNEVDASSFLSGGDLDISVDQERILEENANLIVSALSMTQDDMKDDEMVDVAPPLEFASTNVGDEEENELKDAASDCNSSEILQANKGPRIVKPGERTVVGAEKTPEDSPKSIKGRRKLLTSGRSTSTPPSKTVVAQKILCESNGVNVTKARDVKGKVSPSANSTKTDDSKSRSVSPAVRKQPLNKLSGGLKTPPRTSSVKTSDAGFKKSPTTSCSSIQSKASSSPSPKMSPQVPKRASSLASVSSKSSPETSKIGSRLLDSSKSNSQSPSPKSNVPAGRGMSSKSAAIPRKTSGTNLPGQKISPSSGQSSAAMSKSNAVVDLFQVKMNGSQDPPGCGLQDQFVLPVERPKPPVKQGTFTKESPTQLCPSDPAASTEDIAPLNTDASHSDEKSSVVGPEISKEESSQSKFPIVEREVKKTSSMENVLGAFERSEKVIRESPDENERRDLFNKFVNSQPRSPIAVRKSSLLGTNANHPLSTSVHPTDVKVAFAPIDVPKKNAKSKISSLWRRDKKSKDADKETAPVETAPVKRFAVGLSKSPKSFRKSFPVGKSKKESKSEVESSKSAGLSRSETYDKILGQANEDGASSNKSSTLPAQQENSKNASSENIWRRTYTIDTDDMALDVRRLSEGDLVDFVGIPTNEKEKENKKSSVSIFKRHNKEKTKESQNNGSSKNTSNEKEKSKVKEKEKRSKEEQDLGDAKEKTSRKKGFSIFHREGSKKSKNKTSSDDGDSARKDDPSDDISATNTADQNSRKKSEIGWPLERSGSSSPVKSNQNSAVVPPYNYVPSQSSVTSSVNSEQGSDSVSSFGEGSSRSQSKDSLSLYSTKTEMLIARRRQSYVSSLRSLNSVNNESSDELDAGKNSCLVTAV